ncbi:MAG: OmpA family protein [Bacteroidales bacterium]|nr:OmpA family protein [Bacteroidales bacterium]
MRILIIGFFTFIAWSALSSFIYVCKIKGLCDEPIGMQIGINNQKDAIPADTLSKPIIRETSVIPENLIIYFAFDKSDFKPDALSNKYFVESNAYLGQNSQAMLNITGHADAIGTDEYNHALGYRRAQRMQKYFESKGIPANKISIESKGEKEPAADNNTKEGRSKNRRTVITIKK